MTIAAVFAEGFVRQSLIVPTDAIATVNNISNNVALFRTGILSFLVVVALDVIVAWALYVFLKPVNNSISLLTAWFRVVYATIFAVSLFNLVSILSYLNSTDYIQAFEKQQLLSQVMLSINAFNDGWSIGFIFFGLHLGLLGYLVLKSGFIPKFIGILLVIAGLGYLTDSLGKFVFPGYNVEVSMVTFIGELVFMFWLLFKGGKTLEPSSP
jgi:hypothetical protein